MNKIRDNLSNSIVHLRKIVDGNDKLRVRLEQEVARATELASGPVDMIRQQMISDQADAMRKLLAQIEEITQQVRRKLVVCEHLFTHISCESSIDQSEEAFVQWMMKDAPADDDVWMAVVIELIASGSTGTLLDGIVLPHLRSGEVECFRSVCE